MDGLGVHRLWGLSPAIDLREEFEKATAGTGNDSRDEINVLVVGAGDIRHVLRTMANRRKKNRKVNIFLFDSPIECVARHLVLLSILIDWSVPYSTRANTFLEVFGNCLVQERTDEYLSNIGKELVQFLGDGCGPLSRLVDLSHLKFKEMDQLETIFKALQTKTPFEMKTLRDERLRILLGQRYDTREGVYDWDYQNGIKNHAGIIHFKLYKHWRETGVAFEFGDQTYTMPNRTMATYAQGKENGLSKLKRGFWSDIVAGPYFCFGVDCETPNQYARDLYKIISKGTPTEQYRHTAVHVSVYNILAYLFEIETGRQYKMTKAEDIYSGLDQRFTSIESSDDETKDRSVKFVEERKRFAMESARSIMGLKDDITITMVTGESFNSAFGLKAKYNNMFDMIWLSVHQAHLIKDPSFEKLLRAKPLQCPVLIETPRNSVVLTKESRKEFNEKISALAKSVSLKPQIDDHAILGDQEYLPFLSC